MSSSLIVLAEPKKVEGQNKRLKPRCFWISIKPLTLISA